MNSKMKNLIKMKVIFKLNINKFNVIKKDKISFIKYFASPLCILVIVLQLFIVSPVLCETSDKNTYSGLGVSMGFGSTYAGLVGGAIEYYMPFKNMHNLSAHFGIGYVTQIGYAGTIRYGYGLGDRFICDLAYGKIGEDSYYTEDYNDETLEWETTGSGTSPIYGSSLLIGYQRITDFGFMITLGIGACIPVWVDRDFYYKLEIIPTFVVSVGYKL